MSEAAFAALSRSTGSANTWRSLPAAAAHTSASSGAQPTVSTAPCAGPPLLAGELSFGSMTRDRTRNAPTTIATATSKASTRFTGATVPECRSGSGVGSADRTAGRTGGVGDVCGNERGQVHVGGRLQGHDAARLAGHRILEQVASKTRVAEPLVPWLGGQPRTHFGLGSRVAAVAG